MTSRRRPPNRAVTSDDSKIVSGSRDRTIKVWDVNTGKLLNTLEGHTSFVDSVAISSNNSKIVSGSWDKTIKVWDLNTGRLLNTFEGHTSSGSYDNAIKIWKRDTGKCYLRCKFDESMSIALSKNRNFIALGGEGGNLYLGSLSA